MTDIFISARRGAGAPAEILYGTVTFKPTLAHSRSTSLVLPAPTTYDLVSGQVVATNVQPTPAPVAGQIEWAYEVTFKDRHSKTYSFLVGVPDSTSQVNFTSLPRYFETKPPLFGEGPQGVPGEAATVAVGTTTSGTTPSVTNSGTNQNSILDFVLPKGDKGDRGDGVPAGGTALQYIRKDASGAITEWATLDKASVGLTNVDNTSDADKPVSSAQNTAITQATTLANSSVKFADAPSTYREGTTTTLARVSDGWPEIIAGIAYVQVTTARSRGNQGGAIQWITAYAATEITPVVFRTATSNGTWSELRTVTEMVAGGYVPQQMSLYQNVFVGEGALGKAENLRVRNNNAFGIGALANATRARYNDAFGLNALYSLDSGISEPDTTFKATRNSAFGSNTQRFNKTGYNNVSMGRNTLQNNETGIENVAIGAGSMCGYAHIGFSGEIENQVPANVSNNVAVGVNTLMFVRTNTNTAIGDRALTELKNGQGNTALGYQALRSLDTGLALNGAVKTDVNWPATYTTATGKLVVTRAGHNLQPGYLVQLSIEGMEQQFLYVLSVSGDTFTLDTKATDLNTNLSGSCTIVYYATDTQGRAHNYNTAVGRAAGEFLVGGESAGTASNTLLGFAAGRSMQDGTQATSFNNATCVGANSRVSGSQQVQLGPDTATVYAQQAIQLRSDARDKTDIRDTVLGLDFIEKLRPVDYKWDRRSDYFVYETKVERVETEEGYEEFEYPELVRREEPDGRHKGKRYHHGLIAQEVEQVIKETGVDFGGFQDHKINGGNDILSVGYEELIAPLIKAVQELSAEVKALKESK